MDLDEIRKRLEEHDRDKWDLETEAHNLRFHPDSTLQVGQNGNVRTYGLADLAVTQLCQRLGIPARYFKRLPLGLQAQLANHDLEQHLNLGFFLRGRSTTIRAILSDRYVAYDNREVVEAISAAVRGNRLEIRSFSFEERSMFLKLTLHAIADESLQLKAGVMIGNSEVGFAQVTVEPFVFRLPCTNDLIVAQESVFRHRHVNFSKERFSEQIGESIALGLKQAGVVVSSARAADQQPVLNPTQEIEELSKEWKLGRTLTDTVLAAFESEPRPTRFGVANSFTRAAQRLRPIERIDVERMAGRFLAVRL